MNNINKEDRIFKNDNYESIASCIAINTDCIEELLYILTQYEFRFLMYMLKYIKGNKNILYIANEIFYKPATIQEISNMVNIDICECESVLNSLMNKNIISHRTCKYTNLDSFQDVYIINPIIFFPMRTKIIEKSINIYNSNLNDFILKDILSTKNKPTSKKSDDERGSQEYQKWRFKALERDNDTCQCCGAKEELEVHHIENYSTNEDLRLDLNNAMVLCKNCHSKYRKGSYHDIYGTTGNSRAQLEKYIIDKQRRLFKKDNLVILPKNESLLWVLKIETIVKNNIEYLQSDEFVNLFPNINALLGDNKRKLIRILKHFSQNISINNRFGDTHLFTYFYKSMMENLNSNPCDCSELSYLLRQFFLLDMMHNIDGNDKFDVIINDSYYGVSNYYTIPEYNASHFINAEHLSKLVLDNNLDTNRLSVDNDYKIFSDTVIKKCFPNNEYNENNLEKNNMLIKEIVDSIFNKIESQGYVLEKDYSFNEKYKEVYQKYNYMIINYFKLNRKKSDTDLRKIINIIEKKDFIILYK